MDYRVLESIGDFCQEARSLSEIASYHPSIGICDVKDEVRSVGVWVSSIIRTDSTEMPTATLNIGQLPH